MIHSEFERAKNELQVGDKIALTLRGNYGEYVIEGILVKVENNRIYLRQGLSHHYTRIISMCKVEGF